MVKVLLVDDHAVVRAGYRQLIVTLPDVEVVAECDSGEAAFRRYFEIKPNVVVMDLNLPTLSGLETIRRIKARDTLAAILVFTIHNEKVFVQRAIEAGATGYLSKSCQPDDLIKAIYAVAKGDFYVEPGLWQPSTQKSSHPTDSGLKLLSTREFDVYCLLVKGMSTGEMADKLFLSEKTVANYVTTIKRKLGVKTVAELIRSVYQLECDRL